MNSEIDPDVIDRLSDTTDPAVKLAIRFSMMSKPVPRSVYFTNINKPKEVDGNDNDSKPSKLKEPKPVIIFSDVVPGEDPGSRIICEAKEGVRFIHYQEDEVKLKDLAKAQKTERFFYRNCLDRDYDDIVKNVRSVMFRISRYHKYSKCISFTNPVSEKEAISAAEQFLSLVMTEKYYDIVKDDLFHPPSTWDVDLNHYDSRGDALGDLRFLEFIRLDKEFILHLTCGS